MDIIISGYGRMGKEVEKICIEKNYKVISTIDDENDWTKLGNLSKEDTVVIDFSLPGVAVKNYMSCFKLGIPIVTGTTGWYDSFDDVIENCINHNGTFFYATNFSIGVNLFFKANADLAKIMASFKNYRVRVNETHHIHKIDEPSGTAITIAEEIINANSELDSWILNTQSEQSRLPIFSAREGEVTGKHEVVYESNEDILKLVHDAKNRRGFALGAVLLAAFIG